MKEQLLNELNHQEEQDPQEEQLTVSPAVYGDVEQERQHKECVQQQESRGYDICGVCERLEEQKGKAR